MYVAMRIGAYRSVWRKKKKGDFSFLCVAWNESILVVFDAFDFCYLEISIEFEKKKGDRSGFVINVILSHV